MSRELTILAIDTGSTVCQVGLLFQREVFARHVAIQSHSQVLLEQIDSLLRDHNVSLESIDAIAVNIGPGSFTGLRVGVSCAQGLALGLARPVVALRSLEIMALDAAIRTADDHVSVFTCIDARMAQIYAAWYSVSLVQSPQDTASLVSAEVSAIHEPAVLAPADLDQRWPLGSALREGVRTGSGNAFFEQFSECYRDLPMLAARKTSTGEALTTDLCIDAMLKLALLKFKSEEVVSAMNVQPNYIRNNVVQKP